MLRTRFPVHLQKKAGHAVKIYLSDANTDFSKCRITGENMVLAAMPSLVGELYGRHPKAYLLYALFQVVPQLCRKGQWHGGFCYSPSDQEGLFGEKRERTLPVIRILKPDAEDACESRCKAGLCSYEKLPETKWFQGVST